MSLAPVQSSDVSGTFALINVQSLHDDSPSDQCLGIDSAGNAGNWHCTFGDDQAWDLNKQWPGTYYYEFVNKRGKCLRVAAASKKEGAEVVGFTCVTSHPDQYWGLSEIYVNRVWAGYYAAYNLNSGYVLGVAGGSPDNGAPVVQWP